MKNFNPNIHIVNKVVIDDPNTYIPHLTSRTTLFLNVIIERTSTDFDNKWLIIETKI